MGGTGKGTGKSPENVESSCGRSVRVLVFGMEWGMAEWEE